VTTADEAPEDWRARLDAMLPSTRHFRTAVVLSETPSTQDAPETRGAPLGTVVVALRQTAGRGRFGRPWIDTEGDGLAVTFVVDAQPPERLALAGAMAAAEACEAALDRPVGVKWPNDVEVDGRKLAGVLIEVAGARAVIGIGINVGQRTFPEALADRATSLMRLGCDARRIDVLLALVRALDAALSATDATLVEAARRRDVLRGTVAIFATPEGPVEGEVVAVDPMRGIVVRTGAGERFLPAHSTTVSMRQPVRTERGSLKANGARGR